MTSSPSNTVKEFAFDDITVNVDASLLLRAGEKVPLGPRPFEVLIFLIENRGRVVTKQELFEQVWGNDFVTDAALTQVIKEIRLALGDDAHSPKYVRTVHRKGYQFITLISNDTPIVRRRRRVFQFAFALSITALLILVVLFWLTPSWIDLRKNEAAPVRSLAVLPFRNLSASPDQEFMADGMTDVLIAELGRYSALRIISMQSVLAYKKGTRSIPEIANQLDVQAVVEGSFALVEDEVRVIAQLVQAHPEEHLWAEIYNRRLSATNIFSIQTEIAEAVAKALGTTLLPVEQQRTRAAPTENFAAFEAYLKGNFHVERFTPKDMKLAAQYYQQAVDLDPDNALAYAGLAKLCTFQAQMGLIRPQVARERCLPPIEKALELDDSLPDAQLAYAVHMTWLWYNWEEGEAAFLRAIELNPSFAEAHMFYSHFLTLTGRIEEGTEQMRLALELDPLNPFVRGLHGMQLLMAGDLQGAIRVIEDVLASTPGFGFGNDTLSWAYHHLGKKDKAIAALANQYRISNLPELALALETAYAKGDYSGAMLSSAQMLEERSKTVYDDPLYIGSTYEQAGEAEKAIDWYELSFQITGPNVPYLGAMTKTPAVQSNPRFIKLLRDIKLDYWADKYSQPSE